ncbi:nickel/cobalt transporter [Actinoplanes couchii]|uniref:Nickel/cobalt efflux system n=1 Tax=Actinoplanes couchii TaxID=403638 RepID=A0ABQ3XSJ1_9ACTN|nr:hypothetical protein [Actinoplanes couchii]MDR6320060.1 ABC-type nickel/cobalt efflux system permease component RcnA [Actinoplanes couchii]GID61469.1 hypothetical protein Aco03nite_098730 [Actinoplanes couchii]
MRYRLPAAVAVLAAGILLPSAPATAHPLDQVVHEVTLYPDTGVLGIEVDLLPGTLVAGAFARTVDTDGDGALSPAEIAAHAASVVSGLSVTADGTSLPVTVGRTSYPEYAVMASGGGVTAILASIALPTGTGEIGFTDGYSSGLDETVTIDVSVNGAVTASSSSRILSYQVTARAAEVVATPGVESGGYTGRVFSALREPLGSPWTLAVLIGVCALLGAFHALTPGHGKTLMAAYLVGAKSTPRQAITLGGIITVTHTASVILLGTMVVLIGDRVMPGVLVPALELAAGGVVLFLGIRLAVRRWRSLHTHRTAHAHAHSGDHTHSSDHAHTGDHSHAHDHGHSHGRGHSHSHDHHVPRSWRELLAMGLSGGMIPCPEALSILILAVGLNRAGLGVAMIVAFSIGLAAVLVGLGLFLVTVRGALQRIHPPGDSILITRLPLVSAAVVVILGVVMFSTGVLHATAEASI